MTGPHRHTSSTSVPVLADAEGCPSPPHRRSIRANSHWPFWVIAGALTALLAVLLVAWPAQAQERWSPPFEVSRNDKTGSSWFADVAAAPDGSLHITWYSDLQRPGGASEQLDLLMHRALINGDTWGPVNDVYNPGTGGFTVRNSIAAGPDGRLHAIVRRNTRAVYLNVPLTRASEPQAWSEPFPLNNGSSYFNAIAVDARGRVHAIYHETVDPAPGTPADACACGDLFYRHSDDQGRTWSAPFNLSRTPEGSIKPQIKIDAEQRVHVVWEEGFDWFAGRGTPTAAVYRSSVDGGQTWGEPVRFTLPQVQLPAPTPFPGVPAEPDPPPVNDAPRQIALGLFQNQTPVVIYRATATDTIYFQQQTAPNTWTEPAPILSIRARTLSDTDQDTYAFTTDGSGRVHLLLSAYLAADRADNLDLKPTDVRNRPRLLHLTWDGSAWSEPSIVASDAEYPGYDTAPIAACDAIVPSANKRPRVLDAAQQRTMDQCALVARYPEWVKAVVQGNVLHVVWFTRNGIDLFTSDRAAYQVWHSALPLDGPPLATPSTLTPAPATPVPVTPLPATVVPTPTLAPQALAAAPPTERPAWELSGLETIGVALLPVGLFVLLVIGIAVWRRR